MAGRSYSIRGTLRPGMSSLKYQVNTNAQAPPPPRPPNRIPASIYNRSGKGARG